MTNWYYAKNDQKFGPISFDDLKKLARSNQFAPDDLVWRKGMADWVFAKSVEGLFESVAPQIEASDEDWYFANNGQGFGPFSLVQVRQLFALGRIKPDDLIWQHGAAESRRYKNRFVSKANAFERPSWTAFVVALIVFLLALVGSAYLYKNWHSIDPFVGFTQSLIAKFETVKKPATEKPVSTETTTAEGSD